MTTKPLRSTACVAFIATLCSQPLAAGDIKVDGRFVSTAPTGMPPLEVASSTLVPNLNADFLDGLPASAFQTPVANVVRVGKSGAPFTSIQAALDSITDAALDNWYVVLVGPGVYNESVTLKDFVSVIGYGRLETRIHVVTAGNVTAVQGSALSALSDLWVVAGSTDGGNATAVNAPVRLLERVRIQAETTSPGEAAGLRATGAIDVDLIDTTLEAHSGDVNTGIHVESSASVVMDGGSIFVHSGNTHYGVNRAGTGFFRLRDVFVFSSGSGIQSGSGSVNLERSSVEGFPAVDLPSGDAFIAYSRVNGTLTGAGSYHCIGLFNSSMDPVSCP